MVFNINYQASDNEHMRKNNLKLFYKYVLDTHCRCESSCLTIHNIKHKYVYNTECDKIHNDEYDYSGDIKEIIGMFLEYDYLTLKGSEGSRKYYIHNEEGEYKFLSWENIKSLGSKNNKLFWMFRKAIVDGLIKSILSKDLPIYSNLIINSVGSTNLTSDYDITVYDNNSFASASFIKEFNERFFKLFKEKSSYIFDTNLYGTSFISFMNDSIDEDVMMTHSCNNTKFSFVKSSPIYNDSQIMWSLVKFLSNLEEALGTFMSKNIYDYMNTKLSLPHLIVAKKVMTYIKNAQTDYIDLMANPNRLDEYILNDMYNLTVEEQKLIRYTDFVSLVNSFGFETYYSRGAFLDIVVNTQMCKNSDIINLNIHDYIESIIENIGFFLIHSDKGKYIERVLNSLKNLKKISVFNRKLNKLHEILSNMLKKNKISKDSYICNISDLNLSACRKYTYFEILVKLVYYLLDHFMKKDERVIIPFELFIQPYENISPSSSISSISNMDSISNSNIYRSSNSSKRPSILINKGSPATSKRPSILIDKGLSPISKIQSPVSPFASFASLPALPPKDLFLDVKDKKPRKYTITKSPTLDLTSLKSNN